MATPHADHLNVIKTWRTDPIEQANKHLEKVSSNLADIATINRRVAADLGLEGPTPTASLRATSKHSKRPRSTLLSLSSSSRPSPSCSR